MQMRTATCMGIERPSPTASAVRRDYDTPSTKSMLRKGPSSSTPTSSTPTALGWRTRPARRASSMNMDRNVGSVRYCSCSRLRAHHRKNRPSRRKTSSTYPIPPWAIVVTRVYDGVGGNAATGEPTLTPPVYRFLAPSMTNAEEVLTAAARISFAAGEHGNFRGFETVLARLATLPSPHAQAWSLALRALSWSFDPAGLEVPTAEEARRFVEQPEAVRQIAARACAAMERACIRTFDVPQLALWIDVHAALDQAADPPAAAARAIKSAAKNPEKTPDKTTDRAAEKPIDKAIDRPAEEAAAPASAEVKVRDVALWSAQLWKRLLLGDTAGQEIAAKSLFDEASRQRAAPQVIESTVLRALLALSAGLTEDAVDMARRASRMAQSESLPQLEYLANVTLARVRRYSGRPHLALHILAALLRVAPPAWSGWIGWEMLLGGGEGVRKDDPTSVLYNAPAMVAQRNLAALIAAARGGDRSVFVQAAIALEQSSAVWPDLKREVQSLLAALDPMRDA